MREPAHLEELSEQNINLELWKSKEFGSWLSFDSTHINVVHLVAVHLWLVLEIVLELFSSEFILKRWNF